jgi:choice-of-anchor B domain-containing protein
MRSIFSFVLLTALSLSASAQYNFTKISNLVIGNNRYSNIWGYTQNNKEYALLACQGSQILTDACAIIDITNPSLPTTLFKVPGPNSLWREIRTWQHYAYVTTEASDNTFGVTIVDLQYLPDSIKTKQYTANGLISNVHALHIEDGYLYLYGANNSVSQTGALIINLADPWNPTVAGAYSAKYVHDGIVRNNKMYAGEIFDGTFSIVDVTNKANPVTINAQVTPDAFTHNTWLSSDSKYLFTTDERPDAFVTSYDISDPLNIKELDRYRRPPAGGAIPHNTYVLKDSLVTGTNTDWVHTSYYTMGTTIVDAAKPDNLVEIAHYDTSPLSGNGFQGAWGVYPYLPSGNVIVSDMELGLFVLQPNYQRACYLEGLIKDGNTSLPIGNAKVTFLANSQSKTTKLDGSFKTGIVTDGNNLVRISAQGYQSKDTTVNLVRANVLNIEVYLKPAANGIVQSASFDAKIYPSIVTNDLYIDNPSNKKLLLVLNDLSGKNIRTDAIETNHVTLNLSELTTGTYIVQLLSNDQILYSEKILKQ